MGLLEELKEITKEENIFLNEPMKNHTTFRTGGPADYLVIPETVDEIKKLIELDCKKTFVGNGSNLLVKDGGIRGLTIKLTGLNSYTINDDIIEASAGCYLAMLSQVAMKNSLTGLEFACGIPGTLGGAVMMNAGAYGSEMSSLVLETEYISKNGIINKITDHEFGYRKSIFQQLDGAIILSSKLKLQHGNMEEIKNKMDELMASRNAKQPINYPSAGSTFKRPEGFFAGKLIEDAGLKGYRIGGAEVSTLHAGFIINAGNATSTDILNLIKYVQDTVKEKYNVLLEPEVKIIGED